MFIVLYILLSIPECSAGRHQGASLTVRGEERLMLEERGGEGTGKVQKARVAKSSPQEQWTV